MVTYDAIEMNRRNCVRAIATTTDARILPWTATVTEAWDGDAEEAA